ncbi:MAG TPA: nitrous oxide reductase family maturation protein NosD [Aquaticitalea sp.]|nr:nitrous oxide reductase family maturation protein NosD [Aquaticitalea sp.]
MSKAILFLAAMFMACMAYAQIIEVCPSCKTSTLDQAIGLAKRHDTIIINKGHYKEHNIIIDKPLTIIGKNSPLIDGDLKGEIITIVADSVTIDGLSLINVGNSYTKDYASIRIKNSKQFKISNITLEKLFFGIYIEKSNYGKIHNNTIKGQAVNEFNSGNGIHLWYSNYIDIEDNVVENVRDGIYLEFSNYCNIKNNISSNNLRYGLHFMFSNNDLYQHNLFKNNGAGVAIMFSKQIKMFDNTFKDNWGAASYGMLLKEIYDAEIIGNNFTENTIGINIEGSTRILYKNNNFIKNGWALKVRGACYANTFTNNNFLHNSFDVAYNSKINDNIFDRNFWSNYTGYDLNKDGIGDVPYRPVKLFTYIVNRTPESIVLLRSLFIDIIDFSEKVSPVFTPDNLLDNNPLTKQIKW